MELKKVIKLLKELPADTGLDHEDNWEDSAEVKIWRKEVLKAIDFAVKSLENGDVVGTLNIDGKEYKVTK